MGSGNPGDKPGYKLLPVTGDFPTDEVALNALADQGYRVEQATLSYILLANYPGN